LVGGVCVGDDGAEKELNIDVMLAMDPFFLKMKPEDELVAGIADPDNCCTRGDRAGATNAGSSPSSFSSSAPERHMSGDTLGDESGDEGLDKVLGIPGGLDMEARWALRRRKGFHQKVGRTHVGGWA
jgi:hypothetical protein